MSAAVFRLSTRLRIRQPARIRHLAVAPEQRQMTVCFTGHRQLAEQESDAVSVKLDLLLPKLYQQGYRRFLCGGALGFDTLAAEAVMRLQATHSDVMLVMAIPCATQTMRWNEADTRRYEQILYAADETHVLSPAYYNGCMMVRNRFMVDRSALCVCYLNKMKGGTMSTVAYAVQEKLSVLNLAMVDDDAASSALHMSLTAAEANPSDSLRS